MYTSLHKSQDLRADLVSIVHQDAQRKSLVRLAVLKALQLGHKRFKTSSEGFESRIDELHTKKREYEVSLSKLRQHYITKERIQELKIEQLHDEVSRLKLQLKGKANVSARPAPQPRKNTSVFSTSPYLSRAMSQPREQKSYLSPTINSLNKSVLADSTVLSPIPVRKKKVKKTYTTARSISRQLAQDSANNENITPIAAAMSTEKTSEPTTQHTVDEPPQPQVTPERTLQKMKTRSAAKGSPTKTPSRLSFVANFDRSDEDDSSGSDHGDKAETPNRTPGSLFEHPQSFEEVLSQHSFSQNMGTSTPATNPSSDSANVLASTPSTRPKRKLSLRKASLSKVTLAPNKSHLTLDDDNVVDYRDEQFADTSFGSPKAKTIRSHTVIHEPPRKKRNVFKID